jgi:hypothetical protein
MAFNLQLLRLARGFRAVDILQLPSLCAIDEFRQFGGRYELPGHGVLAPDHQITIPDFGQIIVSVKSGNQPRQFSAHDQGRWPGPL